MGPHVRKRILIPILMVWAGLLGACNLPPVPVPTSLPLASPTTASLSTASATPTATNTFTPTPSPTPTFTPTPTATPTVSPTPVTATWIPHTAPAGEFSLLLPPGWVPVDLNEATIAELAARFKALNPELAGFLETALMLGMARGMRFFAYDARPGQIGEAGALTSLNVVIVDLPTAMSAELLGRMTEAQLANMEQVSEVESSTIVVSDRPAVELVYTLRVQTPLGEQELRNQQILLPVGQRAYVLTFSTERQRYEGLRETFNRMRDRFRLMKTGE